MWAVSTVLVSMFKEKGRKGKKSKGKEKETSMLLTCRSKLFPGNKGVYRLGPYIRVIG